MVDKKDDKHSKLANIAFNDAMDSQSEKAEESHVNLSDKNLDSLISEFEGAAQSDDDGVEYWKGRDLQVLLGYSEYRNFQGIIDKAKTACENSGQQIVNHFVDVTEMVEIGSGAIREIDDIKLTRYACYLIAQNGDSRKKPIAFAQTYFAIQTRRQEIQDEEERLYKPLNEDEKRLVLRDEIKEHNKNLASTAKRAGVVKSIDFAIFQNFGYKGLYGGLDNIGIHKKKKLKAKQPILDHMGSTELAANLFRTTQTEEKLRRENIKEKEEANLTHYDVGAKVRQTIKDIGGTMPENLPVVEDIKKVSRRIKRGIKSAAKEIN